MGFHFDENGYWDTFFFGFAAGGNFDPAGYSMRRQYEEALGIASQAPVFQYDPNLPDGPMEKAWDAAKRGLIYALIFPFLVAFRVVLGPFRRDLRWPGLTRWMAALSVPAVVAWNTSPAFHRMDDSIGEFATFFVQWGYIIFLIGGVATIPATVILVHILRKAPKGKAEEGAR